jgi:hypothetical protein
MFVICDYGPPNFEPNNRCTKNAVIYIHYTGAQFDIYGAWCDTHQPLNILGCFHEEVSQDEYLVAKIITE